MVNINTPVVADETKALTEKLELQCDYGQIDGNYIRSYRKGAKSIGRFGAGSVVTVYAGRDKVPVDINIGCKIWATDLNKFIFGQVYVTPTVPAGKAVENFLQSTSWQRRLVDFRIADYWYRDIEVLPGNSIIAVINMAVDVLTEGDELNSNQKMSTLPSLL